MTNLDALGPLGSLRADLERRVNRRQGFENITMRLLAAFPLLRPEDRAVAIEEICAWLRSEDTGDLYDGSALVSLVPIPELVDDLALTAERLSELSNPIYTILAEEYERAVNKLRASDPDR